jgi:Zn-dependent peptidase ImmA (M78 family)/DNA-binding XRE family transcriptional regulator
MINGERVRQAREFKGLTQSELAERIGLKQSAIAHLETGRSQPSQIVLEGIAFQTGFPPAFFRQETSTAFPLGSLLFRAKAAMTRAERAEAHQYARTVFEQYDYLSTFVNKLPVAIPKATDDPCSAARLTRSALGMTPDKPVPNLIRSLERAGVIVLALPKAMKNRDAFSTWVARDELTPVIVLAACDSGDRVRFSVAHELGHLVMHRSVYTNLPNLEKQADEFASEFLMPRDAMVQEMTAPITVSLLMRLKQRWKVSIQSLARRAHELGLLTIGQYKYLMQQFSKLGWRKREPIDVSVEKPRALRKMAELVYGVPLNVRRFAEAICHPISLVQETLEAYAGDSGVIVDKMNRGRLDGDKVLHLSDLAPVS